MYKVKKYPRQFGTAFCIKWPENMQFKECIIDRYIIKGLIEFVYDQLCNVKTTKENVA